MYREYKTMKNNKNVVSNVALALLVEEDSLCKKVLEAKYGGVGQLTLSLGRGNKFSLW
jgi:hypothetical protein